MVRATFAHPSAPHAMPAVILVHGDHGVTDWVKDEARRFAERGYAALAVDLYRGEVVSDLMDAHILERGLPEDRARADLKAAVDYLGGRSEISKRIGILGWDTGAGYALDAAIHDPRLQAVVFCYGRLITDPQLLAPLHAPVLGIFGEKDVGISPETIEQFQKAMHKAGKRVAGIQAYPGCGHDFLDPSLTQRDAHPSDAIADAWSKIDAFFAEELKAGP
jgi:carboxymethylenebutenolidase